MKSEVGWNFHFVLSLLDSKEILFINTCTVFRFNNDTRTNFLRLKSQHHPNPRLAHEDTVLAI